MEYEEIVLKHKAEKEILKNLEETVSYKINNPILMNQRDIVNRLKDKLIYLEEEKTYVPMKRHCTLSRCIVEDGVRTNNPKCQKTIQHNLKSWILYGNGCRSCNKIINKGIDADAVSFSGNVMLTGYEL